MRVNYYEIMEEVRSDMGINVLDDEWDDILDKIGNWTDMEIEVFWTLMGNYGAEECYDIIVNEYYHIWWECDCMFRLSSLSDCEVICI